MASAGSVRPLVIGIGTDERSDDGIGLDVARELGRHGILAADVREGPGDLTRLLDVWEGRDRVILVDATRSEQPPGTIHRWDRDDLRSLPTGGAVSSHGLSLADVLELARELDRLPARLTIFGIEAGATTAGTDRSAGASAAVPEVCRRIEAELRGSGGSAGDA